MASDILNSELFAVAPTPKKDSIEKPKTELKQEGNSLFSTLLEEAKTKISKIEEAKKEEINPLSNKTATSSPVPQKKEVAPPNENTHPEKKIESSVNTPQKETKTISLLEKMVQDAKSGTQGEIKESSKAQNSSKIVEKETQSLVKSGSQETVNEAKSEAKPEIKEETKPLLKTPSSLLEKMVQDAKSGAKGEIKAENSSKVVEKETQSLVKSAPKETVSEAKSEVKNEVKSEAKAEIKGETKEISKVVEKETQIKTPSTLLEKMVQDAKNVSQKENELKSEVKKENLHESKIVSKPILKEEETTSLSILTIDAKKDEKIDEKIDFGGETKTKNTVIVAINPSLIVSKLEKQTPTEENQKETPKKNQQSTILATLSESISGKTKQQKIEADKKQLETSDGQKAQFGANMFLSNQKVQGEILSKQKLNEGVTLLKEGEKTTKTVSKAAEVLDLKAKSVDITGEKEAKVTPLKSNEMPILANQQAILNRIFLQKESANSIENLKIVGEKVVEQKTNEQESKKTNTEITMTVERSAVEVFTSKVVASKQMMGSFMSDVARNMYLNYKPPVTALRINLDPINLGNISIVMRNNKAENSLSISLNMSQNATLETFNDNKTLLQNALGKVFNTNDANISLDFGLQNENTNQEFEQFREGEQKREQHQSTHKIVQDGKVETEISQIETNVHYM